jgi:hypothetical protein
MTNAYYTSPTDISAGTKARSVDINTLDSSVDAAFDKLPTETNIKQGKVNYAVTGGSANAYTISLPHAPASYADGLLVDAYIHATNGSGGSTVNVNGLGVKSIKLQNGDDPAAGDLQKFVSMRYSTTTGFFHAQGSASTAAASASASAAAAAAASSAAAASESTASAAAQSASESAALASGYTVPFSDANPLVKGSADDTKRWRVEVDGFTAGQTRVGTPPDADFNMAGTNLKQEFSKPQRPSLSTETAPSSNAVTWDLTTDSVFRINLNANITTFNLTGTLADLAGYQFQTIVRYNGGTAVTWNANMKLPGTVTLTGTSGKVDIFNWVVASANGTDYYLLCTGYSQNLG